MSDPLKGATWLLTEHLRYTPLSLVDDIINSVNALLYRAVSAVENGLLNTSARTLGFKPAAAAGSRRAVKNGEDDNGSAASAAPNGWHADAKLEIENGVHQLETLFESTVDKDFDKLEIYVLRNVFSVPEDLVGWVRLPHYELEFSNPPDAPTPESLQLQRRKLLETRKLHRALLQESNRNKALIRQMRALVSPSAPVAKSEVDALSVGHHHQEDRPSDPTQSQDHYHPASPFAFLTSNPTAKSLSIGSGGSGGASSVPHSKPLTTTTSFALSQLHALRALLVSLRPKLDHLSATPSVDSDPTTGSNPTSAVVQQDQRTHYIETQTRRHLERTRGLALTETGALGDGEWQGTGRRVGPDEVRDLERVAGLLSGSRAESAAVGGKDDEEMEDAGEGLDMRDQ